MAYVLGLLNLVFFTAPKSDIKPQNMGFDVRGNIKIFDFGLAKSLVPHLQAQCGLLYHLTAKCGSLPYMAPEVALSKPYNEKCDVYSFSIVLFEIVSLQPPFSKRTKLNFSRKVLRGEARPRIHRSIPPFTKKVLKRSWSESHTVRPDMATIAELLQCDVDHLAKDDLVHARTHHILNLSNHSIVRDEKKSGSLTPGDEPKHDTSTF